MRRRSFLSLFAIAPLARVLPDSGPLDAYGEARKLVPKFAACLVAEQTIDGVVVEPGTKWLFMNHGEPRLNGVYVTRADSWSRST